MIYYAIIKNENYIHHTIFKSLKEAHGEINNWLKQHEDLLTYAEKQGIKKGLKELETNPFMCHFNKTKLRIEMLHTKE